MAATATERKLFIDGDWVETGEWVEVRSPYSGEVVGRVARGGADETRRALDAADRALQNPLPAHKRAEILVKVAGLIGRRHEEVARTIVGQPFHRRAPFFWSVHYDLTINYVGHAERFDRADVVGDLDANDAVIAYRSGPRVAAVTTVGRDHLALEIEAAMERGDDAALEALLR